MALKIGNRVTVLTPSDPDKKTGNGALVKNYAGKRGEVVQIGATLQRGQSGRGGLATCPDPAMVLVDDQIVDGEPRGTCTMRDWFDPEDLEVG